MTEEELEKEAEDYAREWLYYVKDLELHHKEDDKPEYIRIKEAYLASAKSREKQIEELKDKCRKLEIQNQKMKCCANCKNEGDYKEPYRYGTGWCNICKRHKVAKGNFDKWEIKEK